MAAQPYSRLIWLATLVQTAEAVAKCGVAALDKGKPVAIPGPANRAAAMFAHLTPKALLVPILAGRHPGLKA